MKKSPPGIQRWFELNIFGSMMAKGRIFLIVILALIPVSSKSQFCRKPFILEPRVHAGMALPLYEALSYLIEEDIYSFDIAVVSPSYGKDFWEKLYNYPRTGTGFSMWSLGNNEVFGKAYVLYKFISLPVLRSGDRFSLNYQVSFGGAWITKKFDIESNPINRAIGSNANIYLRLGLDGRIRLSPACELLIEAGAAHFSNGKTRSPNYGINLVSSSIGINYLFNQSLIAGKDPEIPVLLKKNFQSIFFSAGSKVSDDLIGEKFLATSFSYNFEHLLSHRRRIGAGADLFYDGSIRQALASDEGIRENDFSKLVRLGIHGSYAMRYRNMMMGLQLGHYLYSRHKVLTNLYSRISLQYLITENLFWGASIKAHMGKADCLELGLGYCW
jgi:hypothetical protein